MYINIYGELDPVHKTRFAFRREHIAKVNIPSFLYTNQHIDNDISHGSKDYVIVPDIIKITFNLDIK